jgi:hypothetical protein
VSRSIRTPLALVALALLVSPAVGGTATARPAGETRSAIFATRQTSHEGISLTFDTALASSVWGESRPRNVDPDGPFWENLPAHVRFLFNGYPAPREFWTPNLSVFPVRELLRDHPLVERDVAELRTVLQRRPNLRARYALSLSDRQGADPPPYVPAINAGQIVTVKPEYVSFGNGSGVRYLTTLAQDLSAIESTELLYVYQGLSSDGSRYLSVIVPVSTSVAFDPAPVGDVDTLAYNRRMADRLDKAAASSFTPNLSLLDGMVRSVRIGAAPAVPTSYTFPQTGFEVSGRVWQTWLGGWQFDFSLFINGLPITSLRPETNPTDGRIYPTQWFERARYEVHTENRPPFDVLLGLLGAAAAAGREGEAPFRPVEPPWTEEPEEDDTLLWFEETKHTVGDSSAGGRAIADYWNRMGGLPQFGYPISQPFRERSREDGKEYLVQYFQRQRFEYHPEHRGTEYEVQLGRLGAEQKK